MKKFRVPAKLYLLASVLTGVIIMMGGYGVLQMYKMNQNTRTLYNDRILPMDQLGDIRFFYESILNTAQQVNNQQITNGQAFSNISTAQDSIKANWKEYLQTYLTPREKIIAGEATLLMKRSDSGIEQLKKKLKSGDDAIAGRLPEVDLYGKVQPTILKVTQLINLQINVSEGVYYNSRTSFSRALIEFVIFILVLLVCVIPFSLFLVRDVRNLIFDLHKGIEKTQTAEEKYKSFIKYAGDAIFILDESLQVTEANDSACSLLGYTKEELLKMKISDIIMPEEQEAFHERLNLINTAGNSIHERRLMKKDGNIAPTEVNVRIIGGEYIAIVRDIGEREKAAAEIRASEEKYKYLFENNPAYIIIWDLENFNVLEVNDRTAEKYGYTKEEFKRMTAFDYRHPDEYETLKEFASNVLKSNLSVVSKQWTHFNKNGDEMLMEISSHRITYNGRDAILSLAVDVTERVKAEKALGRSEEKFHSLVDHAADAVFMVLDDGIIFDVNKSASEMLGYSRQELIGMTILDLHVPEVRREIPQTWDHLRKSKSYTDERRLLRKDGTTVEVQISRTMLPDASGAIAIVRDITEQKAAQERIKNSEERHRALIENISDGIILMDENLGIIYKSPSAQRITGFTQEEQAGKEIFDFIHPDDIEICASQYQYARANPGMPVPGQCRALHKEGYYIWVDSYVMNLLDNKSVNSYVVIYRDITEQRKFAEQQLLITSIVSTTDDAIISKTLDGIVTSWNKGAETILGYSSADIVGKHITTIVPPELAGEEDVILQNIRNGQSIDHYETNRVKKNGEIIDVSLTISPIKDVLGNIVGASKILRDITEKKKAQNQLKRQNEKLLEIAFLQSHIVRRPAANVIGLVNLINKDDLTDPENAELIAKLEMAVNELDEVIAHIVKNVEGINV